MLFNEDNKIFFAPALPLEEVFDPTGAGDTFAGGFVGYLAKTDDISFENMKRAVITGSAMASFCVEKFGTERLENLSQGEIYNRIMEFVDLAHFDIKKNWFKTTITHNLSATCVNNVRYTLNNTHES